MKSVVILPQFSFNGGIAGEIESTSDKGMLAISEKTTRQNFLEYSVKKQNAFLRDRVPAWGRWELVTDV